MFQRQNGQFLARLKLRGDGIGSAAVVLLAYHFELLDVRGAVLGYGQEQDAERRKRYDGSQHAKDDFQRLFHSSAITSHSSSTSLGRRETSTQERAGKGSVKYLA